jgi:dihydroorotate dehydrogenase
MSIYQSIIRSILFRFESEKAHNFGIHTLKYGLNSQFAQNLAYKKFACEEFGELERFGLKFNNPLGIAAGFDKNGIVVNQLASIGFGFVEVGTVTYETQSGNKKPRMFRLPEDDALINRLGFNNQGTPKVIKRLKKVEPKCVVGVNIGKNKDVPNEAAIENYVKSFDLAFEVADYIAVNVSSPNTPNLRELQKAENLEELLRNLQERNEVLSSVFRRNPAYDETPSEETRNLKPLLVKIAPDLDESEIEAIVDIALRLKVSGIIATNTTIGRSGLKTSSEIIKKIGNGGLSGTPIAEQSSKVIQTIHKYSKGKLPIIGVGGIFTAEDAFEKIALGASLLQSYTGFVYQGVSFARDINFGLVKILKEHGFNSLDEAVGCWLDG